ncbi:hypothetical protein Dsin_001406 [Dipteronia sinensis]|uniref:Transposase MuDR plant domain-containing protein n=1 Tax=Dipteronia sinensis TaxID=43782 RepID=A0AAE0EK98_9ROSI|nr:hypothetical protein Dsin_001406 [Dipteronia sinensis]
MRDIFKEYAIKEGVELKRVKNHRVRQTCECTGDGCVWRANGSYMIDGVTFMIKTLLDQHDCQGDLLRENYKALVDIQRLYKAKHRASKELAKDHAKCSRYLRRPFIGVDGCHLKGPFGGVLLLAMSLDANSGLFPLAICICEKETNNSWE